MELLRNMTVTKVFDAVTVTAPVGSGSTTEVTDRPSYGLSLCYEGQITYELDGERFVSDPYCAILLPKDKTYLLHWDRAGSFPLINFDCEEPFAEKHVVLKLKNPSAVIKEFEYIQKLSLFDGNRLKIMSAFYALIDGINSQLEEGDSIIRGAVAYLEANIADSELCNEVLAKQANISEVYFRQLFLKQYGVTPRQYIINARIVKAKQLLATGDKKISAVAEECGFVSVYHFSRCFKEKVGVTPTEYLNANRIQRL